jgi:ABC-2 type transport system ATP-binding protein
MSVVLAMEDVVRSFDDQVVLHGVSLTIEGGQIVSVLGPNGAGKSKVASTLLAPDSGRVWIEGVDAVAEPRRARNSVGLVLGGDRGFYMNATVRENLEYFAALRRERRPRVAIEAIADLVPIAPLYNKRFEALSKGQRQLCHLARGLIGDPQLLILDEPTSGLDIEVALEVRALVAQLAAQGRAVLLTTHYLHEAEQLSSRFLMLKGGTAILDGDLAALSKAAGGGEASLEETYLSILRSE